MPWAGSQLCTSSSGLTEECPAAVKVELKRDCNTFFNKGTAVSGTLTEALCNRKYKTQI